MADLSVQIKNRNGAVWDLIFPKTKAELVETSTDLQFVSVAEKTAWNAKQAALAFTPENVVNKGIANGYAGLDGTGKVPSTQLPSYVDDVLEVVNFTALPATGADSVIYVTEDNNLTYRWTGSAYVEISASLALGSTSATAYRGDYGALAYAHALIAHAVVDAQKNSDITKAEIEAKLTGVISTHSHAAGATAAHASTHVTGGSDVIPNAVAGGNAGLLSGNDKTKLDGIAAGATAYSHPTGSGNTHLPAGGSVGQTLKYSAAGVAQWDTATVVNAVEPTTPLANDMWYQII